MTSEEKQKKAEEKARRRAEIAEQNVKRKAQLSALKKYWAFFCFDINGRACPKDFFLFWARQLLFASQKLTSFIFNQGFELLRFVYFLPVIAIIVVILCVIFPPLLAYLVMVWNCLIISVNMLVNAALLLMAAYIPFFLAGVKRRINDMSTTAAVAHTRFLLFAMSGALVAATFITGSLSWFWNLSPFMPGGCMYWLTSLSYILLFVGIVLVMWQIHYYSYCPGVSGENFAGANPVETEITEESLADKKVKAASSLWQAMSIVLVVAATAVAFSLSSEQLQYMDKSWGESGQFFSRMLVYGMLGLYVVGCLLVCCVKRKYKKGFLAKSEIDAINECFMAKSDAFAEEMKKKAIHAAEEEGKKSAGSAKTMFGLIGLIVKTFVAFIYWCILFMAIVSFSRGNCALAIILIVVTLAAVVCYNYFKSNVGGSLKAIDWQALFLNSGKQLLHFGREVLRLPFSLSDAKSPDGTKLPTIAEKRLRVRNISFFDPLGMHQFALGQMELVGVQILFCILIVGIPISWLWSIFDGIRFSRMSDEEFLVEYPDYCFSKGIMDKFVRLMSKIAIGCVPIVGAAVLLFIASSIEDTATESATASSEKTKKTYETLYEKPVNPAKDDSAEEFLEGLNGLSKELERGLDSADKEFEKAAEELQRAVDSLSW